MHVDHIKFCIVFCPSISIRESLRMKFVIRVHTKSVLSWPRAVIALKDEIISACVVSSDALRNVLVFNLNPKAVDSKAINCIELIWTFAVIYTVASGSRLLSSLSTMIDPLSCSEASITKCVLPSRVL